MKQFLFIVLTIFFVVTPYQRGLFFDTDLYFYHLIIALIILILSIYMIVKKIKIKWYFILFAYPFINAITVLIAESPHGAIETTLRWFTYTGFFFIVWYLSQDNKIAKYLPYLIHGTGLWITLLVILNYYGVVSFTDAVLDNRFSSVFQYPNTFAMMIGVFLIYGLYHISQSNMKPLFAAVLSIPMVLYGVTFLFTYSRGVFLVLPLVWIFLLFFIKFKQQLIVIIYSFITFISSMLVFRSMNNQTDYPGVLQLIVFTILFMSIVYIITLVSNKKYDNKGSKHYKYLHLLLPVLIIIIGSLITLDIYNQGKVFQTLPQDLQNRISAIDLDQRSVQGRLSFFTDAIEMSKDSILFGLGGEGWRLLFTRYQDIPYWSTQTHSGYLTVLLNTGVVGLLVFLATIGFLLMQMYRRYKELANDPQQSLVVGAFGGILMIFIHSAIDFNFQYGTVWFTAMFLFAINQPEAERFALETTQKQPPLSKKIKIGYAILLLMLTINFYYSYKFYLADNALSKLNNNSTPTSATEALRMINKSLSHNPYNIDERIRYAQILISLAKQNEKMGNDAIPFYKSAIDVLERSKEYEPNNARIYHLLGLTYVNLNKQEKAIENLNKALSLDHYNNLFYEDSIRIKTTLAYRIYDLNKNKSQEMAMSAVKDYERLENWYRNFREKVESGIKINERKFRIYEEQRMWAAESYLLLKEYERVVNVVKPVSKSKNAELKKKAYILLAVSYDKLNQKKQSNKYVKKLETEFKEKITNVDYDKVIE